MLAAPLARVQPGSGEEADCVRLGSGLPIWGWKGDSMICRRRVERGREERTGAGFIGGNIQK